MALPFFYTTDIQNETIALNQETSKHITQVLRMKINDEILLTNGKGIKAKAVIVNDNKRECIVKIQSSETVIQPLPRVAIGISLIKNSSRFEWFLEKAAEMGVSEIIPLLCTRTEKQKFRSDRMKNILQSGMLQSQQCWLPVLHEPVHFDLLVQQHHFENKFIAHCNEGEKTSLGEIVWQKKDNSIVLIGPEGDFTPHEIEAAVDRQFRPVSLGNTRLRTETAGIAAAVLMCCK
ncbi:MAG: 16S rRNA (uracil(1498)-N(3))-methyltransferase [Chitinophagaceae bacterium]|nr:16S rRNA (uracil(1498)-N(3))-methyltransferase [Chitinophagaceae bacterium]